MRKSFAINSILACAAALVIALPKAQATPIIFDDFDVNLGHFTSNIYNASGSDSNIKTDSTSTRVTTDSPVEGAGHQKLVINATTPGTSMRIRHLSGAGTPANNVAFTTSAGIDGWVGVYIKTLDASQDPNWNVQLYMEGASTNGGIPKTIIADGEWHLYEWNLDDNSGGPDGWGTISGIVAGVATVADGSHTFDSIVLRNSTGPATTTLFIDFLAKSDSGSVANVLATPCLATSGVLVGGPLSTNTNTVVVTGVDAAATALTVYQDSGSGMVAIGSTNAGIVAGNNTLTVSGLVKGAVVAATQTKGGIESCIPTGGIYVGGGANPSVRVAFSIKETTDSGPVGASATDLSSLNIHFLGASTLSGGAPVNAPIFSPSNQWQTVTFSRGNFETVGDSANPAGTNANGSGYAADSTASIQVYAYRVLTNNIRIYSANVVESSTVTSNDVFNVNWTWDAVPGAQGYRLLRNTNGAGYLDHHDVTVNSYSDNNSGWTAGVVVTPTTLRSQPSIKWNFGSGDPVGTQNSIPGDWGILESIDFNINSDAGPFDLYIDNIQNGSTVFQTFESVASGTFDYGFRQPSFSGSTGSGLLAVPNLGVVTNNAADTGTNAFRIKFQWNSTNAARWLRLTTSGAGVAANPLVNLDDPISFRMLLLPVGASLPVTTPTITYSVSGNQIILNWTGTFNLESKTNLNQASWDSVATGITGYTNTISGAATFYRLHNP